MHPTRRQLLRSAAAVSAGFVGLHRFIHVAHAAEEAEVIGYGPTVDDPNGVFDLPEGFSYHVISKRGERMDDGLFVPGLHDGSAAFAGPDGKTILIRNHEITEAPKRIGPFGWNNELFESVDRSLCYDAGFGKTPCLGGTTTVIYDTKKRRVERQFMSLIATGRNCAGGPTPWGSWITCEEWTQLADDLREKDHGYVFEVPSSATGAVPAVPIPAMGRFNHEAVAVDPVSGVVYLTEDRGDSLLYRFIPERPGDLHAGGRLQAMALRDRAGADTRNYVNERGEPMFGELVRIGEPLAVTWIDLESVDSPRDDLRYRGHASGAARFARGEGMWYGRDSVFFACTTGGARQLGQIWRYVPSRFEGKADERSFPGTLQLFVEPNDSTLVENADNLVVAPWGDLFVCEDGPLDDRLVRIDPEGNISTFARNRLDDSELTGATFSPDGTTLFVNLQTTGVTLAITGPWYRGRA